MRVRIWQAFASNNSGSYTIVGTFRSEQDARAVADAVAAVLAEHTAWRDTDGKEYPPGEAPLHRFIREHTLTLDDERTGLDDDWPDYSTPHATSVGKQALVHVPGTITMPRVFGEFFFRRGGRVDVEIDHAHEALVMQLTAWKPGTKWTEQEQAEAKEAAETFRAHVEREVLPALAAQTYDYEEPLAPHVWSWEWFAVTLSLPTRRLLAATTALRDAAARHGLESRLRVFESMPGPDPLAPLRTDAAKHEGYEVVLWRAGADPAATMRALREVAKLELAELRERMADLPTVVLARATREDAARAVEALRATGADADALGPRDLARR
jgi:hypothetical protein